jgi:transglutaminase-like putative cysteine protease
MNEFLKSTDVIDWQNPAVSAKARELSAGGNGELGVARRCFEWVRDQIQHSSDFKRNPVTCAASEVLAEGTGYCYAKSHLLAALLRANGIPAGFCYQRLSVDETGPPFSLHGLNAVCLPQVGWYRIDARGNKPGVDAQFSPPVEKLAFPVVLPQEKLYPEILADPLPIVILALRSHTTWDDMYRHLPDWELSSLPSESSQSAGIC